MHELALTIILTINLSRGERRDSTPPDELTIIPAIRRGGALAWRSMSHDGDRCEVRQRPLVYPHSGYIHMNTMAMVAQTQHACFRISLGVKACTYDLSADIALLWPADADPNPSLQT